MLNRTNRTLSANLNRLNLGTRSFVLKTGVNIGDSTLRVRHAHAYAMRDGMFRSFDPAISDPSWVAIPSIPCSSPVSPWPGPDRPSSVASRWVVVSVVTSVDVVQAVNQVDGPVQTQADRDQDQTQARTLKSKGSAEPAREYFDDACGEEGSVLAASPAERTARLTAAATAAAGG